MDNSLTPEKQKAMIEDALHTYPTSPLPRDITPAVMARIRGIPAIRPLRFSWNDFVLSTVFTLCIAALWFSLQHLPPFLVAQIRKESILFYQHVIVNARWLIPALSFGLAGFFVVLAIPFLRRELMR
jgi:hypothetical protein